MEQSSSKKAIYPDQRKDKIINEMNSKNIDILLLEDMKDVYYLTGYLRKDYGWQKLRKEFYVLDKDGSETLIIPKSFIYEVPEDYNGKIIEVKDYDIFTSTKPDYSRIVEALASILKNYSKGRVGLVSNTIIMELYNFLVKNNFKIIDLRQYFDKLKMIKYPDEIEIIKEAEKITKYLYELARTIIEPGKTEQEIYSVLYARAAELVNGWVTLAGDFVSGERTLELGGPPSNRAMLDGDILIIDLWFEYKGYWVDNCRSFTVGDRSTFNQKKNWELVLYILKECEELLRPGIKTSEIYKKAWSILDIKKLSKFSPLHVGHGIGLTPHEEPLIIPGSNTILGTNMVCTLEIGLYVPETQGMRCEENYIITDKGFEKITNFSKSLSS